MIIYFESETISIYEDIIEGLVCSDGLGYERMYISEAEGLRIPFSR